MKKLHSTLVAVSISLAMALTLPSCSNGGGGGDGGDSSSSGGNALLLNFTSDMLTEGVLRWMKTDTSSFNPPIDSLEGFDQDSKVFAHDGKIFILQRPYNAPANDGILNCLNPPSTSSSSSKPTPYGKSPQNLVAGSNPYDIAFDDNGNGYIAQYGVNFVQVFDVDKCKLTSTIPLPNVLIGSSASGATQNAASIKAHGNKLFVVMQRWNPYPTGTVTGNAEKGVIVRLNADGTPTNPVVDTVGLKYYNPQSSVLSNGKLYIASAYNLSSPPGIDTIKSGIEYLNSLTVNITTTLINGGQLGNRGPTSMVLGNGELWVIAYKEWITDLDARVMSVSFGGSVDSARVSGVDKATCLVYDNVLSNLFIGNGTAFSTTTASLLKYDEGLGRLDTIGKSQYTQYALPPYSLAIVRY